MDIFLNGRIFINGADLTLDNMDLTSIQTTLDYLVIIGMVAAGLLLLDLVRRIMSASMRVKDKR
jgi:hypothetical protein